MFKERLMNQAIEQNFKQLKTGKELPRFGVTYTPHLQYYTEIEAPTLESAEAKSEEIYTKTDLADYNVDGHDETWQPLNEAARRLLDQRRQNDTNLNTQET
jgi:hypothetical protein